MRFERRLHRRLERLAVGERFDSIDLGRDPRLARPIRGRGASGLLERTSAISAGKSGDAGRLDQRRHVGAAPGNERGDPEPAAHSASRPRMTTRGALARNQPADRLRREAVGGERRDRRVGRLRRGEDDHAEAAVERAQHFRFADAAGRGEPGEDRRRREGGKVELDRQRFGQHARQIVGKAAAGDMGERQHAVGRLQRRQQRLDVEPGRLEQRGGERALRRERRRRVPGEAAQRDDAANERKAVGMDARRRQADRDVARLQARRAAAAFRARPRRRRSRRDRNRRSA